MPNDGVRFEDQIVATIIDLGLQNFQAPIAALLKVFHNLASEQVFKQGFTM